jgi:hypothetical protein
MKDDLDEDYYSDLEEIVNKAMNQVSDRTGKYLHNLRKHKPDEDTLQNIIDNVPLSLSYINEYGDVPIYTTVIYKESVGYVPLLAKEGVKHKVGGDNGRGGLLVVPNNNVGNVLHQLLLNTVDDYDDTSYLNAMKKLRESNLLRKKDIKDHDLLSWACHPETSMRFDFLADWCPERLKTHNSDSEPLIHEIIEDSCDPIKCLPVFLKASLKHYPNDLGLLFQKDSDGQTACALAFEEFGKDKSLKAIGGLIPFDDPRLPILHHVAKHTPQYIKDFACRYRAAIYFRDFQGRTLHQSTLSSGHKTFSDDPMFFLQMSDEQVREIDPGSDLYPFMVAASGQTSDLSAVYALLRRNPSLAHRNNKPKRRTKRKRK